MENDEEEAVVGSVESVALLSHTAPEHDAEDAKSNHEKGGGQGNEDVILDVLERVDHLQPGLQQRAGERECARE